jgi:hypothetical protein
MFVNVVDVAGIPVKSHLRTPCSIVYAMLHGLKHVGMAPFGITSPIPPAGS